jgi:hypothetical protein
VPVRPAVGDPLGHRAHEWLVMTAGNAADPAHA